ncbi:MAG: prepilin peptidase [Actinomycetota bacterium]|nr:prepilin peptidase [Actinomycetota bacterium]
MTTPAGRVGAFFLAPPILEAAAAAYAVAVVGWGLQAPVFAAWAALLVALARIDVATHKVPNKIIGPALVALFPAMALASAGDVTDGSALRALLGGVLAFVIYLVVHLGAPGSFGAGDVKASPVVTAPLAFMGWTPWWVGLVSGFILMAVVSAVLLATKRIGRTDRLPFVPFLALGAFGALLLGGPPS